MAPGFNLFNWDMLTVTLIIVDDHDRPVPYATVGSVWEPYGGGTFRPLTSPHLWRSMMRNPEAWEYWNSYIGPLPYQKYGGLTDFQGVFIDRIDYAADAADRQPRPDPLTIAYAVYKKGYEPAQQTIIAKKYDNKFAIRLTLKRAADYELEEKPYIRTLYEVRYEISDWRANEKLTRENQERLERLRRRLEQAAEQAIAADDLPAASRILYWVAYMPEIQDIAGRPIGYAQTNIQSPRNISALKKAAALDPNNHHVQSMWLVLADWIIMHQQYPQYRSESERIEKKKVWLQQALALERMAGNKLWPVFHDSIIWAHDFIGDHESKYKKILWMQEYEPKFDKGYQDSLEVTKQRIEKQRAGKQVMGKTP